MKNTSAKDTNSNGVSKNGLKESLQKKQTLHGEPAVDTDVSTEDKIKEAARKVFLKRGFEGATTRDIAAEADVNVALVNYYFRSKEKLFKQVFNERLFAVSRKIMSIFEDDLPLEVKIYKVADQYTEFFLKEPDLPLFLIRELQRSPQEVLDGTGSAVRSRVLEQQLKEEAEKGNIRPITAVHLEMTCAALVMFPFMMRSSMVLNGVKDHESFEKFIRERQKIAPEMVMAYLKSR